MDSLARTNSPFASLGPSHAETGDDDDDACFIRSCTDYSPLGSTDNLQSTSRRHSHGGWDDDDDDGDFVTPCYTPCTEVPTPVAFALEAKALPRILPPPQCSGFSQPPPLEPLFTSAANFSHVGRRSSQEDTFAVMELNCPGVEDTIYAAVFDGHNGNFCSEYASNALHEHLCASPNFAVDLPSALVSAFRHTDASLKQRSGSAADHCGCTAIAACLRGRQLTVANLGDCRAVLSVHGKAVDLTTDHKASDPSEIQRIRRCGGDVEGNRLGTLNISRALGDFELKHQDVVAHEDPLSNVADVTTCFWDEQCDYLLLASDGLWDVMTSQEAVDFVSNYVCQEIAAREYAEDHAEEDYDYGNAMQYMDDDDDDQTPAPLETPLLCQSSSQLWATATDYQSQPPVTPLMPVPSFSQAFYCSNTPMQSQTPPEVMCTGSRRGHELRSASVSPPCTPRDILQSAIKALVEYAVVSLPSNDNITVVAIGVRW